MCLEWVNYAVKDSETLDISLGMEIASTNDLEGKFGQEKHFYPPGSVVGAPIGQSNNSTVLGKSKGGKSKNPVGGGADLKVPSLTEKQMKLQKALQIAQEIEDYRYADISYRSIGRKCV